VQPWPRADYGRRVPLWPVRLFACVRAGSWAQGAALTAGVANAGACHLARGEVAGATPVPGPRPSVPPRALNSYPSPECVSRLEQRYAVGGAVTPPTAFRASANGHSNEVRSTSDEDESRRSEKPSCRSSRASLHDALCRSTPAPPRRTRTGSSYQTEHLNNLRLGGTDGSDLLSWSGGGRLRPCQRAPMVQEHFTGRWYVCVSAQPTSR